MFVNLLCPQVYYSRVQGLRVVVYLDDSLDMGRSKQRAHVGCNSPTVAVHYPSSGCACSGVAVPASHWLCVSTLHWLCVLAVHWLHVLPSIGCVFCLALAVGFGLVLAVRSGLALAM